MRKIISGVLFGFTLTGCGAIPGELMGVRQSHVDEESILLAATQLFVPQGFDDNDQTQIVIDGWLNNACEEARAPKVNINLEQGSIEVLPIGVRKEGVCAQVRQRYTSVANVGILPQGTYRVYSTDRLLDTELVIEESHSAGPDDYLYAEVDNAFVDYAPENDDSRWSFVIEGTLQNSCQKWDELKVIDSGKSVQVLPITHLEAGENCVEGRFPFVRRGQLPDYREPQRVLLHVRSLAGTAHNHVFSVFNPQ